MRLENKRDSRPKPKTKPVKMVRRHDGSTKIDMGLKKASPQALSSWRQCKKLKISLSKQRPSVIRKYTKEQLKKRALNIDVFNGRQTATDKEQTNAVENAMKKHKAGCLRAVGRNLLVKTLSVSEKKRKPMQCGDHCIAVPQGPFPESDQCKQGLALWEPCTFVSYYCPNSLAEPLCIVERTIWVRKADKRLSRFFAVLSSDCFLVPPSFSDEFRLNYLSNEGVYVIESEAGNVYVGSSKDIEKRIEMHNLGRGATFTCGGKWWRILPSGVQPTPQQLSTGMSQETVETLAQIALRPNARVRGGALTSTKR